MSIKWLIPAIIHIILSKWQALSRAIYPVITYITPRDKNLRQHGNIKVPKRVRLQSQMSYQKSSLCGPLILDLLGRLINGYIIAGRLYPQLPEFLITQCSDNKYSDIPILLNIEETLNFIYILWLQYDCMANYSANQWFLFFHELKVSIILFPP